VNQNHHTGYLVEHKGNFLARHWLFNVRRALKTVPQEDWCVAWSGLSHTSRDCDRWVWSNNGMLTSTEKWKKRRENPAPVPLSPSRFWHVTRDCLWDCAVRSRLLSAWYTGRLDKFLLCAVLVVEYMYLCISPLWSSGQSFWIQIQRSRVRVPALLAFF
jgi:hypothetical protein